MKNIKLKGVLFSIILLLSTSVTYAQYGPTFTQYTFNEAFINPAYTGSQDALAVNASYRNQWVGVEGAPITETFVAHTPVFHKTVGIGITAYNEHAGILKTTAASLNLSYRIIMNKSTLSFGLSGGIQNFREDLTKVKTGQESLVDNQFLNRTRIVSPNCGFGVYYYTRKFYAGVSIPRMIQLSLSDDSTKVVNRVNQKDFTYYGAIGYVFDQNENAIWKPYIMTKILQGAPIQSDFSLTVLLKKVLWAGASYRTDKTLSGIVGFQFNPQFKLTYSYDYTFSDLQKYNSGSHEIQLSYVFSFNKEKIVTPRLF
jgi:type IX secretion system PorP/SprF family membrane protein